MINIKDYELTVFGDSIAKGVITSADGKPSRTEASAINILQNRFNKDIDNRSAFGQTLKKIYDKKYIDDYISNLDTSKNNCVFFAIGGNDSDFNWKEVAQSPTQNHQPNTQIKEFRKYLNELVNKLKKAKVKVFLITLVPMDPERFFNNFISKQTDKDLILKFLKNDISNIYKYQERFSSEIIHCAISNNCELIDLRSELLCRRTYLKLLCKDGIHPNKQGQKAIAQVFIKYFNTKHQNRKTTIDI